MKQILLNQVVGVFRRCQECGEVKPLQHFIRYNGRGPKNVGEPMPGPGYRVCASCRGKNHD